MSTRCKVRCSSTPYRDTTIGSRLVFFNKTEITRNRDDCCDLRRKIDMATQVYVLLNPYTVKYPKICRFQELCRFKERCHYHHVAIQGDYHVAPTLLMPKMDKMVETAALCMKHKFENIEKEVMALKRKINEFEDAKTKSGKSAKIAVSAKQSRGLDVTGKPTEHLLKLVRATVRRLALDDKRQTKERRNHFLDKIMHAKKKSAKKTNSATKRKKAEQGLLKTATQIKTVKKKRPRRRHRRKLVGKKEEVLTGDVEAAKRVWQKMKTQETVRTKYAALERKDENKNKKKDDTEKKRIVIKHQQVCRDNETPLVQYQREIKQQSDMREANINDEDDAKYDWERKIAKANILTQNIGKAKILTFAKILTKERPCMWCGSMKHGDQECPKQKCVNCGTSGHEEYECPYRKCSICGKKDHDDWDCPDYASPSSE